MKAQVKKVIKDGKVEYYGKLRFYAKTTGFMDYFIGPFKTRQEALREATRAFKNAAY